MRLLTEEKLRIWEKKEKLTKVVINKDTLITPSARQYINEKNIEVLYEDEDKETIKGLKEKDKGIEIEASGRHMHLSREDIDELFGEDYQLTIRAELSQPGQYICQERLTLIGPKGVIENVGIIGPEREKTQIELSKTDARVLGVNPPIRDSGDIEESETLFIASDKSVVKAEEAVILAKRHIHMTTEDAKEFKLKDGDMVKVKVDGDRGLIFDNVLVRVNDDYSLRMHIDYDEANAINHHRGMIGWILE